MRTTRKTPKPPTAKARRAKLRDEAPDLADLVEGRHLTLTEAEAAAWQRARERLRRQRQDAEPQPGDAWLSNNLPVPETLEDEAAYLWYVLAHCRALAADVKYRGWPLSEAVFRIHRECCPWPCDEHHPLSAGLIEAFLELYADDPGKAEQAREVADWATYLVPDIIGRSASSSPRMSGGGT